jgi:hypothetical protein
VSSLLLWAPHPFSYLFSLAAHLIVPFASKGATCANRHACPHLSMKLCCHGQTKRASRWFL